MLSNNLTISLSHKMYKILKLTSIVIYKKMNKDKICKLKAKAILVDKYIQAQKRKKTNLLYNVLIANNN